MPRAFFRRAPRRNDALFCILNQQQDIDKMIGKQVAAAAFKAVFKPGTSIDLLLLPRPTGLNSNDAFLRVSAASHDKFFGLVARSGPFGTQSIKLKSNSKFDEIAASRIVATMGRERRASQAMTAVIVLPVGAGLFA